MYASQGYLVCCSGRKMKIYTLKPITSCVFFTCWIVWGSDIWLASTRISPIWHIISSKYPAFSLNLSNIYRYSFLLIQGEWTLTSAKNSLSCDFHVVAGRAFPPLPKRIRTFPALVLDEYFWPCDCVGVFEISLSETSCKFWIARYHNRDIF